MKVFIILTICLQKAADNLTAVQLDSRKNYCNNMNIVIINRDEWAVLLIKLIFEK